MDDLVEEVEPTARARAPRTARQRVHAEMTNEILAVARRHLAKDGTSGLSVRSIARDLGMAPSALYRYFDGRDALLTALILAAFESLADEAERAAEAASRSEGGSADRFLVVPRAMRRWALRHPHDWGLVFGTPVPGYQAPEDTVGPYTRVATALVRPIAAASDAGRLAPALDRAERRRLTALRDAVAPVAAGLLPRAPTHTVVRVVEAWTTLVGVISLEVFGHWRKTILDPEAFFEATMHDVAGGIGLS